MRLQSDRPKTVNLHVFSIRPFRVITGPLAMSLGISESWDIEFIDIVDNKYNFFQDNTSTVDCCWQKFKICENMTSKTGLQYRNLCTHEQLTYAKFNKNISLQCVPRSLLCTPRIWGNVLCPEQRTVGVAVHLVLVHVAAGQRSGCCALEVGDCGGDSRRWVAYNIEFLSTNE